MRKLHPVFNVVKLLRAPEDPISGRRPGPPPEPEIIDGEPEYKVEKILDSRCWYNRLQFLVSWKGYGREENSWADEGEIRAPDLIKEFYQRHPGAPRRIWTIRFGQLPFIDLRLCGYSPKEGGGVRGTPIQRRSLDLVPTHRQLYITVHCTHFSIVLSLYILVV